MPIEVCVFTDAHLDFFLRGEACSYPNALLSLCAFSRSHRNPVLRSGDTTLMVDAFQKKEETCCGVFASLERHSGKRG